MQSTVEQVNGGGAGARMPAVVGLPLQLTAFVGRARELQAVSELIAAARLVTLTGPGGTGKTRLAAEVVARGAPPCDLVLWADLAAQHDATLVGQQVAAALGVREPAGRSPVDALVAAIGERRMLLVLDNCEHVVDACALLTDRLLRACAGVTVMTTSREALGIGGERAWLVPPLSLPEGVESDAAAACTSEAVQLFVLRAQAVAPDFALTATNASAVARICRRLDGIPLAIELAAARVRVLGVHQLAERLEQSFTLLGGTQRRALPRQRTLQEAIEWSYALLGEREQRVLQRLSVFAGGFTLDAAERVCAHAGVHQDHVVDLLGALVNKSLVVVQEMGGSTRYRLLEAIRDFARAKLQLSGDLENACTAHAACFVELAEEAAPHLFGGAADAGWMARIDAEIDNLRALAEWAEDDPARTDWMLRLGVALHWYLFARGWFREGHDRLTRALAHSAGADAALRARAATALASIRIWRGDAGDVPGLVEPVLGMPRQLLDPTTRAYALTLRGAAVSLCGEPAAAAPLLKEAVSAARRQPMLVLLAIARYWQALNLCTLGEYGDAEAAVQDSLLIGRRLGHQPSIAHPLTVLGLIHARRGASGDAVLARGVLLDALDMHLATGDRWGLALAIEGLASVSLDLGELARAARLLGAAEALRSGMDAPRSPSAQQAMVEAFTVLRSRLGVASFEQELETGRRLDETALGTFVHEVELRVVPTGAEAAPGDRAESAALRVRALGALGVEQAGADLTMAFGHADKPRELLALLLLHRAGLSREQIGLALWPDASAAQLRNSFHVTLHRLRRVLGAGDWVVHTGDRYAIPREREVAFDVDAFTRDVRAAHHATPDDAMPMLRRALAHYGGDLLDGEPFGEWLFPLRTHLQRLHRDALLSLALHEQAAGAHAAAVETLLRLLALDPLHESAARALMTSHARLGQRADAMRAYQQLAAALDEELGVEPEPATLELLHRLESAAGV